MGPRIRNVCGELKRWFLDGLLALEVVSLGAPVGGDWGCVPVAFDVQQEAWVRGGDVNPLDSQTS